MQTSAIELAPSANAKAPPHLTPAFYTSSLFVNPLREDVKGLGSEFERKCLEQDPVSSSPFTLFKSLWKEQGWDVLHLKCMEPRSRAEFLKTIHRVFLEEVELSQTVQAKTAALFGMYTFFRTQPRDVPSPPWRLNRIPIAIDTFDALLRLPRNMDSPLKETVLAILHNLITSNSFFILPNSSLHPYSPQTLPHSSPAVLGFARKSGRPTKTQLATRVKDVTEKIEHWVDAMDRVPDVTAPNEIEPTMPIVTLGPKRSRTTERRRMQRLDFDEGSVQNALFTLPKPDEYLQSKAELKDIVPLHVIKEAEHLTRGSMADVSEALAERGVEAPGGQWAGRQRLENTEDLLSLLSVSKE